MWLVSSSWEVASTYQVTLCAGMLALATLVVWKMCRGQRIYNLPARDVTRGHRWFHTEIISHTTYCSVCAGLIVDGWYCDSCGACADHGCFKKADRMIHCKSTSGVGSSMKHHWVRGNVPSSSTCDVCEGECGTEAAPTDARCCWCQRTVHARCLPMMAELCDLGCFRSFVVPPFCVRLKLVGWKGRRHLVVGEVRPPPYRPWCPLVVVANRTSGNNEGDLVLRAFRSVLNPAQVIDLHELPPENGLQWCHLVPDHICRVLVAGGDGTVGWVLNAIDRLKLEPHPHVCVLPLGTGNDLARVLGWGDGSSGDVDPRKVMRQMSKADVVRLDRWKITITPQRHLGIRLPSKEIFMNNYVSVGVDALVALNFHKTRESNRFFFRHRLLNKFLYVSFGTKDMLERQCKDLHKKVVLFLDGEKVVLPELEGIVLLNIPSWAAGVRPWEMGLQDALPQSINDGILEAIGVYSSFHIGQLQVGMSEPIRLGQAKDVKLTLLDTMPVQVDGEPWLQHPGNLVVGCHRQASMLCLKAKE